MTYISPVRIFNEEFASSGTDITDREISLIKRKLLAEAELSDEKTVIRNGKEYSKQDIIDLFDGLGDVTRIDYHRRIFANTALLNFLETGEYNPHKPIDTVELERDNEYRYFILQWFIPMWTKRVMDAFALKRYYDLCYLLELGKKIVDEFMLIEALEPLQSKLVDFNEAGMTIGRTYKNQKRYDKVIVEQYINADAIRFLNLLPYSFADIRNHYLITTLNFTVYMFNLGHKKGAYHYAQIIKPLDCDLFYSSQLDDRLKLFKSSIGLFSGVKKGNYRVYWFIVVIVISIIRIASSGDSHSDYSYNSSYSPTISTKPSSDSTHYAGIAEQNTSTDAGKIAYAALDANNISFLIQMIQDLNMLKRQAPGVSYPAEKVFTADINITSLDSLIGNGWKPESEMQYTNFKEVTVKVTNRSNTPMVLIYTSGPRLIAIKELPGESQVISLQEGRSVMIPYFGTGWNNNTAICSHDAITNMDNPYYKGWFQNKISRPLQADTEGKVTLLNVKRNYEVTDEINFNFLAVGYFCMVGGTNVTKQDQASL